jgi:transposase
MPLLPENGRRGKQGRNYREVVNEILWKLPTGSPWRDLSGRYDPHKKRADERTRTADLTSLRVRGQGLLTIARGCKFCISKRFSVLSIAHFCRVLRAG